MSQHFPYFKPKRAKPSSDGASNKRENLMQTRNLSKKQRALKMANFKQRKDITLPKVNLPE